MNLASINCTQASVLGSPANTFNINQPYIYFTAKFNFTFV